MFKKSINNFKTIRCKSLIFAFHFNIMLIGLYIIRNKAKFKLKTYEKFLEEKLNLK